MYINFLEDCIIHSIYNNLTNKTVSTSYKVNVEVPAFKLEGHVVWGATAMMLSEFTAIMEAIPSAVFP